MSRNLLVLGILFGLICIIVVQWSTSPLTIDAKNLVSSATYNEQQGYEKFVKQLPQQVSDKVNWKTPFYMEKGGLLRFVRDCGAYITVSELLVQQEESETPSVEETQLEEPRKQIALTFDDGPNNKSTIQVLDILQKYDVKATFFVLGQNVVKHPDIVKRMCLEGHEIANHSWSHKNLTKLSPAQIHAEIDRASNAIYEATGHYPTSYRPPFGAIDDIVRHEIQLTPVLWNIDTMDWHHKDPKQTLANVTEHAKNRGIILMHDIHQQSADALEAVILYLQQEDYEFVTTDELDK